MEKMFCKFKAEGRNLFKQLKVRTILILYNLLLEVTGLIKMPIGTSIWEAETYRNKVENKVATLKIKAIKLYKSNLMFLWLFSRL